MHHGERVEVTENFFCEAVWAGDYNDAAFDQTDLVFGSGARRRGASVAFVSSGATVDRLQWLCVGERTLVSNSLACLLAHCGAKIDVTYPRYYRFFFSVVCGIDRYERRLSTTLGDVELVYHDNLTWDGKALQRTPKADPDRDFTNFARYRAFLDSALKRTAANMTAHERRFPYAMTATVSSGYDSPTVAAVARQVGCETALCFDRSHSGEDDSGEHIAEQLGMQVQRLNNESWRDHERPETPFLAANATAEELRFKTAEANLRGRVLLTGHWGDRVWGYDSEPLTRTYVRGDPAGLSLTEYRLWAGCLHAPLSFWGGRQIADINRISRSEEMRPWSVEGEYNRPICRRIVEDAGVARESFGIRKRNASIFLHNRGEFLTPASKQDFFAWLEDHRLRWLKRGALPPSLYAPFDETTQRWASAAVRWMKGKPGLWRVAGRWEGEPLGIRRFTFAWAIERTAERYRSEPPRTRIPEPPAEAIPADSS